MTETKEISLIEKETTEGVLVTNIDELEVFVAEKLIEYTPENYKGDSDAAKKDRALLNASKKTVSAKRIEIIKNAMARFRIDVFETRCKKVEKDIDTASLCLDGIVKDKEEKERRARMKQIETFWAVQNFDLVPLQKVFDEKWLNKTAKTKDIFSEIEKKIQLILTDIKTLEVLEDADVLKQLYLDTLDMGTAIRKSAELKAYREKLAVEAKERADREARKALQEQQTELAKEEVKEQNNEPVISLAQQALKVEIDTDPVMEFTIKFKAKKSVLFALRQYMTDRGIIHEKMGE